MHYGLFKYATRLESSGPRPDIGNTAGPVFDYVAGADSKLFGEYVTICTYFLCSFWDALVAHVFRPLVRVAGYPTEWSDDLWWAARATLVSVIGGMFRRLVRHWRKQPWSVAKVFDPRKSHADRMAEATRFLSWDDCCYERGCCRKLKKRFPTPEALLSAGLQEFMCVLFNQSIIATTLLECDFAAIRAWIAKCKKPLSVANLCATQFVSRIQDEFTKDDDDERKLLPLWMQGYRRRNGVHMHSRAACRESKGSGAMSDVGSAWQSIKDAKCGFGRLGAAEKSA